MSSHSKGSPLSIKEIDSYAVNDAQKILPGGITLSPEGEYYIFCVLMLLKRLYCAISNEEERDMWIRTLQQTRNIFTKYKMGYSNHDPYLYDYCDTMARSLSSSKMQ